METRRTILAATAGLAAVAATTQAFAKPTKSKATWPEFIRQMEFLHPNGRQAAINAFDGGMDLRHLFNIHLAGQAAADGYPALMFADRDMDWVRVFTPKDVFKKLEVA